MRCPNCDFENSVFSNTCLRCGASLEVNPSSLETSDANLQPSASYTDPSVYQEYSAQYRAPMPPPTNGHNRLLPPSPPSPSENSGNETDEAPYSGPSQTYGNFQSYGKQASWTASRVIRSIVYFIWATFGGFGILGAFISINDSNALVAIGLLAWLCTIIASVIVFTRLRHRTPLLRFSKFLYYSIIATALAFVVIIVETAILGDSAKILPGLLLGIILAVYGFAVAILALW
jgi:hypothetical protein